MGNGEGEQIHGMVTVDIIYGTTVDVHIRKIKDFDNTGKGWRKIVLRGVLGGGGLDTPWEGRVCLGTTHGYMDERLPLPRRGRQRSRWGLPGLRRTVEATNTPCVNELGSKGRTINTKGVDGVILKHWTTFRVRDVISKRECPHRCTITGGRTFWKKTGRELYGRTTLTESQTRETTDQVLDEGMWETVRPWEEKWESLKVNESKMVEQDLDDEDRQPGFWRRRLDGFTVNENEHIIYVLEFKRVSDTGEEYVTETRQVTGS